MNNAGFSDLNLKKLAGRDLAHILFDSAVIGSEMSEDTPRTHNRHLQHLETKENKMPRDWLNIYIDQSGVAPATGWIEAKTSANLGGVTVRLLESDRSGSVLMQQAGLSSYGDSEVYLQITFTDGTPARFLSAPLHTPIELRNVNTVELSIIFLVGPPNTPYRALVNAHCLYET